MRPLNSIRIRLSLLMLCVPAAAFTAMPDPQNEALVREIEDNLIAPCCWSAPVSQHFSEVSDQIRAEIREMVAAGKSREEIMDHYVAQYGERILATPRPSGFNILVYILPWVALITGACFLVVVLKKLRSSGPADDSLESPHPKPPQTPAQTMDARYEAVIEQEMKELED